MGTAGRLTIRRSTGKVHIRVVLLFNVNSSPPGQSGRHFVDDIFRSIFMDGFFFVLIKFSVKFVPKSPIDNIGLDNCLNQCLPNSMTYIWGIRGRWEKLCRSGEFALDVYVLPWYSCIVATRPSYPFGLYDSLCIWSCIHRITYW